MKQIKEFILKYFLKFGIVGVINTLTQQLLYFILITLETQFVIAQTFSFIVAFLGSYLLNSKFTYKIPLSLGQFFSFLLANLPAYFIQFLVLIIFVEGLDFSKTISLFLTLFITIPLTFILVSLNMVKSK